MRAWLTVLDESNRLVRKTYLFSVPWNAVL